MMMVPQQSGIRQILQNGRMSHLEIMVPPHVTANGDSTVKQLFKQQYVGNKQIWTGFYHKTIPPIISNTYCVLWRPQFRELIHHVNASDFALYAWR